MVLICLKIKSIYTSVGLDTLKQIGWTLAKPKAYLVHLPSRVDYLGDNLDKFC